MRWTAFRRLMALGVAYAVALHLLLPGFIMAAGVGYAAICSNGTGEPSPAPQPPHHCAACPPACCGDLAGTVAQTFTTLRPRAALGPVRPGWVVATVAPSRRLPPSRAPPALGSATTIA